MDLKLKNKFYLVTGASSGFGRAVAEALIQEGARVLINARSEDKLKEIQKLAPDRVDYLAVDITIPLEQDKLLNKLGTRELSGAFINAGGPPAKSAMETKLKDWDDAYKSLVRWKIRITKKLVFRLMGSGGGKLIFLESVSVKQPVPNLALSNAMRLAMVGYVKTLSEEVGNKGVNMNILAPGYHDTDAMQRIIKKKSLIHEVSEEEARKMIEAETKMGTMGDPKDLASLALWLFSDHGNFITGQTISIDGGLTRGVFG
jgi:3-oxoacyl-[acyl-carrier protein] reductase